jgi:hypothetical protein
VDLRNPFSDERRLVSLPVQEDEDDHLGVLEMLEQLDAPAVAPAV